MIWEGALIFPVLIKKVAEAKKDIKEDIEKLDEIIED